MALAHPAPAARAAVGLWPKPKTQKPDLARISCPSREERESTATPPPQCPPDPSQRGETCVPLHDHQPARPLRGGHTTAAFLILCTLAGAPFPCSLAVIKTLCGHGLLDHPSPS